MYEKQICVSWYQMHVEVASFCFGEILNIRKYKSACSEYVNIDRVRATVKVKL